MTDPTSTTPTVAPSPAPAQPAAVPNPAPTPVVKQEDAIPYARFKEVNDELKTLRDEKTAREQAEQKAKEEKLKKDGEYKSLLEQKEAEIDRLKKVEAEFTSTQKSIRESALAKLTDDKMKGIAAELSTPKLLEFVETYQGTIAPPGSPRGAPVDTKAQALSPKPGESPQDYSDRMRKEYQRGNK